MSTFPGGFVPVAPPADGLRLAFVAARRRRNTKAGAVGTASLLAAVAVLASTGGTGDRTLLQEPLPPASTSHLGGLTGNETAPAPTATAMPTTSDVVSDPAVASGTGFAARTTSVGRVQSGGTSGEASRGGLRAAGAKPISAPMTRNSGSLYTGQGDLMCPARKQQEQQRGLCTDISAYQPTTGRYSITAEICNLGAATETLSYATARELDLTVRRSGIEVWRWSLGRHFAATAHQLLIGGGTCVQWSTSWAQVDSHGVPVKAGSYSVVADFDADEVAAPDRHPSYPVTVSSQP
jgi:hypothetical protein